MKQAAQRKDVQVSSPLGRRGRRPFARMSCALPVSAKNPSRFCTPRRGGNGRLGVCARFVGGGALVAWLLLCGSAPPALAAAPEVPLTKPASGVSGVTATLHGV